MLSGFTLFRVPRGWQLSTRTEGEDGWTVRLIDHETAQQILSSLDVKTPSGLPAPLTPAPTGKLNFRRERVRL